jgi:hypothetical protein
MSIDAPEDIVRLPARTDVDESQREQERAPHDERARDHDHDHHRSRTTSSPRALYSGDLPAATGAK